jgi:bifunctional non-homologous end joining protein LigD
MGALVKGGTARLESRSGQDWTAAYPVVVDALAKLPVRTALLDGEVAVLLADGRTSFQALQNAGPRGRIGPAGTLVYFAFDLLHVDGRDVSKLPLEERKDALELLLKDAPPSALAAPRGARVKPDRDVALGSQIEMSPLGLFL